MIDDGQTVTLTLAEYHRLMGQITDMFHDHSGRWSFPWAGPRLVLVEASESGHASATSAG